jgi:hypothetical protein
LAATAVSLRGARSRAGELRRADPHLSEEEALRRALSESEDLAARRLVSASDYTALERSLSRETREALAADPALRELYTQADPRVRRLLTACRSLCIPTDPRPSPEALARIGRLMDRLSIEDTNPALREYLYENRDALDRAVAGFDDVDSPARLRDLFDQDIRRHATELGGSAAKGVDGRWQFTKADGTTVREYEFDSYRTLGRTRGTSGFFQAHHGIQDAWARDASIPGYNRGDAPALLLRDSRAGTPHRRATDRQIGRESGRGSRTYERERELLREDLTIAEVPDEVINAHLAEQDAYFGRLYEAARGSHTPAQLQAWFGAWTP